MVIHAVVPMKELDRAKSRLAEVLGPAGRRALALEMFRRVVQTLLNCRLQQSYPQSTICNLPSAIAEVWVVSRDAGVLALAAELGARPLPDDAGDLNAALEQARGAVRQAGADALLVVPADVPLITGEDVAALAGALAAGAGLAIAPDGDDDGTNALGLPLPSPIRFQFGIGSFARHLAAAQAPGLPAHVYRSPTLALDVDTPEGLLRYRALSSGSAPG